MEKTYKTIKSVNNIDLSGRLPEDAVVNGRRATFRLVHNFGGDKGAITIPFFMFAKRKDESIDEKKLALLKKGSKIIAHAYMMTTEYIDNEGKKKTFIEYIVKDIEAADKNDSVNNVDITGRLYADPEMTDKRCILHLIHNVAKDVTPVFRDVVAFDRTGSKKFNIPENLLKKGAPVLVHAFFNPDNLTNEDGTVKRYVVELVAKKVEAAELVERTRTVANNDTDNTAEDADKMPIDLDIDVEDGIVSGPDSE